MNPLPFDDALIDRCCLYLLGELPADAALRLEQEALASEAVRECLLQQAELIAALGAVDVHWPAVSTSQPQAGQSQSQVAAASPAQRPATTAGWSAVVAVALAASLLWVIVRDRSANPDDDQTLDSVQLAHAWAAARDTSEPTIESEEVAGWDGEPWLSDASQDVSAGIGTADDGLALDAAGAAGEPWPKLPARTPTPLVDAATTAAGPPEWLVVAVRASALEQEPASGASGVTIE